MKEKYYSAKCNLIPKCLQNGMRVNGTRVGGVGVGGREEGKNWRNKNSADAAAKVMKTIFPFTDTWTLN
jgi:hypothetical protein